MCVFCAAVPVTASLGAMASSKQRQAAVKAEMQGEKPRKTVIPAGRATAVAVAGLVIASVIYHTHSGGVF